MYVRPSVCPSHFGFRTNRSWNKYQTWWIHSLWYSPDLFNFWSPSTEFSLFPDLWLNEQFPHICWQTADQIRLKFGELMHYGPPQTWLTFGHTPLNFRSFLASDWSSSFRAFPDKPLIGLGWNLVSWCIMGLPRPINFWSCSTEFSMFPGLWLVEQFPRICRQTTDRIRMKLDGQMHCGPPHTWLTFGHVPLIFRCFLASDWSSSFRAFADKPLITLSWNFVG